MRRTDRPTGIVLWACLACLSPASAQASPEGPFELKDGDRVVLLGGTFIEREQSYGYLETRLTARFPGRAITFRNLGWSGDTVRGEARARFGPPAEGFAHLKEHVEALKPTVILVNYGLNESFAGKPGLPAFEKDLNTLLDVLDKTGARVVLITPRRLEKLPPPLPDPAEANARLADYVVVLRQAAEKRSYRLVDLFEAWKPITGYSWTDNGIHLTEAGYKQAAVMICRRLGVDDEPPKIIRGPKTTVRGGRIEADEALDDGGIRLRIRLDRLPMPSPPHATRTAPAEQGRSSVRFLVDGKPRLDLPDPLGLFSSNLRGTLLGRLDFTHGPDAEQAEQLRTTIAAKNELYFHRWRPQNETYLFGFRKHEQGNNAREIPLFDPLVDAKEKEIARLRVPVPHTYEIARKAPTR